MVVLLVLNYRTSRLCSYFLFQSLFQSFLQARLCLPKTLRGTLSDLFKNSFLWLFECCYFPAKRRANLFRVDVSISIFPWKYYGECFLAQQNLWNVLFLSTQGMRDMLFKHQKSWKKKKKKTRTFLWKKVKLYNNSTTSQNRSLRIINIITSLGYIFSS